MLTEDEWEFVDETPAEEKRRIIQNYEAEKQFANDQATKGLIDDLTREIFKGSTFEEALQNTDSDIIKVEDGIRKINHRFLLPDCPQRIIWQKLKNFKFCGFLVHLAIEYRQNNSGRLKLVYASPK